MCIRDSLWAEDPAVVDAADWRLTSLAELPEIIGRWAALDADEAPRRCRAESYRRTTVATMVRAMSRRRMEQA